MATYIMKSEKAETTNSTFVKEVMEKIRAISEHNDNGDFGLVEQYYKEHGSYKGIEDWLKAQDKTDSDL